MVKDNGPDYMTWWLSKFTIDRKRFVGPLPRRRELRVAKCDCCGRMHETEAKLFTESFCEDCVDADARWTANYYEASPFMV
jgi:hypothetical protein